MSQTAIISGATSMIGRALVNLFSSNNYSLVLLGRDLQRLEEITSKVDTPVSMYAIDVADESMVKGVVGKTVKTHGRIDVLISNTAVYPVSSIEELDLTDWNSTIDSTMTGPFLLTKYCLPLMKKQRNGKIILLSSIAGEVIGLPNMSSYAASKAGLNGFMRTAALEAASCNVNVNSISPGRIYDETTLQPDELEKKLQPILLRRFVKPRDIAAMALYLASDAGTNITGQNIIIDGGQSILGDK